jgi:hypothetical protein
MPLNKLSVVLENPSGHKNDMEIGSSFANSHLNIPIAIVEEA